MPSPSNHVRDWTFTFAWRRPSDVPDSTCIKTCGVKNVTGVNRFFSERPRTLSNQPRRRAAAGSLNSTVRTRLARCVPVLSALSCWENTASIRLVRIPPHAGSRLRQERCGPVPVDVLDRHSGRTQWRLSRGSAGLETLCRTYWYPIYAFIRRWGHPACDAEDLTQEFFTRLLARNDLASVDPARGKFRTFLLTVCRNFLLNRRKHDVIHPPPFPFDFSDAENRYTRELSDGLTPERIFDRRG